MTHGYQQNVCWLILTWKKIKTAFLIIQNWKKTFALNPGVLEYGNEKAEIIDFYIVDQNGNVTNLIEKDTEFEIYMKVRFHDSVKEPIFAYTIKDIRGTDLTGTNTMYEHAPVTEKVAGDEQVVCFRQKQGKCKRLYEGISRRPDGKQRRI